MIADRRNRIKEDGAVRYEDNFLKAVIVNGRIVYNHGYNRIGDQDWKLRASELTPETDNAVYSEILAEIQMKVDKKASYVFMGRSELVEITIVAEEGIKSIDHMPHDRIVSGDGDKYINSRLLTDLKNKECGDVRPLLERTFMAARTKMKQQVGTEFSEGFDIVKLRS